MARRCWGRGTLHHGDNDAHDYNDVNIRAVSLVALEAVSLVALEQLNRKFQLIHPIILQTEQQGIFL